MGWCKAGLEESSAHVFRVEELSMARLFELRTHEGDGERLTIVDLEKVCLVRVDKEPGHHYQRVLVRFVDGHEDHEIVPPQAAQHFIDAYRAHLREQPPEQPV
jgi:hypothetical protein